MMSYCRFNCGYSEHIARMFEDYDLDYDPVKSEVYVYDTEDDWIQVYVSPLRNARSTAFPTGEEAAEYLIILTDMGYAVPQDVITNLFQHTKR